MAHSDILTWITELRTRVARNEFAEHGPIDVGYGTTSFATERAIRIMLSDLDDLDDPGGSQGVTAVLHEERRSHLLGTFRQLRRLIG
jgi:hypothetical protein